MDGMPHVVSLASLLRLASLSRPPHFSPCARFPALLDLPGHRNVSPHGILRFAFPAHVSEREGPEHSSADLTFQTPVYWAPLGSPHVLLDRTQLLLDNLHFRCYNIECKTTSYARVHYSTALLRKDFYSCKGLRKKLKVCGDW